MTKSLNTSRTCLREVENQCASHIIHTHAHTRIDTYTTLCHFMHPIRIEEKITLFKHRICLSYYNKFFLFAHWFICWTDMDVDVCMVRFDLLCFHYKHFYSMIRVKLSRIYQMLEKVHCRSPQQMFSVCHGYLLFLINLILFWFPLTVQN